MFQFHFGLGKNTFGKVRIAIWALMGKLLRILRRNEKTGASLGMPFRFELKQDSAAWQMFCLNATIFSIHADSCCSIIDDSQILFAPFAILNWCTVVWTPWVILLVLFSVRFERFCLCMEIGNSKQPNNFLNRTR